MAIASAQVAAAKMHAPSKGHARAAPRSSDSVVSFFFTLFKFLQDCFIYLIDLLSAIPFPTFEKLWVVDLRTFRAVTIPIEHNAVDAMHFRKISPLGITASVQDHMTKGLTVLDPGFKNTAVRIGHITHIDGQKGKLTYRGHSVGELFTSQPYESVQQLLIWGDLPSSHQTRIFRSRVAAEMIPHPSVTRAVRAFSQDAPSFTVISAGLAAWAASDPSYIPIHAAENIYIGDMEAVDKGIYRVMGALMTTTALVYCHQQNKTFVAQSDPSLSPIDNMLVMMGRVDEHGNADKKTSETLSKLWILFADHEMTNSTAAFMLSASTLADPLSSSAAAILGSSAGPLHAGAIDLAYKNFQRIRASPGGVKQHLEDVRAKKCRLMGVGHRVYKTVDPRVQYLKELMSQFKDEVKDNPLLEVAMEIENAVFNDEYFTSRKLSINADLYGSFVYAALGFDPRIFTAFACIARNCGILAHWRESMQEAPCLWRPRQVYVPKE